MKFISVEHVKVDVRSDAIKRAAEPPKLTVSVAQAPAPVMKDVYTAGYLGRASTAPMPFNAINVRTDGDPRVVSFACGCYILYGATGGGKSITSRALMVALVQAGVAEAGELNVFESSAPVHLDPEVAGVFGSGATSKFDKPEEFLKDLKAYVSDVFKLDTKNQSGRAPYQPPGVLVIDSISIPIRTHGTEVQRKSATASAGGVTAMDFDFIARLNKFGEEHSLILFAAISTDIVPFAPVLEGQCQGRITPYGTSTLSKRDRLSGREEVNIHLDDTYYDQAAVLLNYPDRSNNADSKNKIVGAQGLSI